MFFEHPTIKITEPTPGTYVISGHRGAPFAGAAGLVEECVIPPEVPDELLAAILFERVELRKQRQEKAAAAQEAAEVAALPEAKAKEAEERAEAAQPRKTLSPKREHVVSKGGKK